MKKMNDIGLMICRYQADLFEYSTKMNVSSKLFVRKFSYSFLSKRMDSSGFLCESIDIPQAYIELMNNSTKKEGIIFEPYIMRWIGFIYRYICYIYKKPMKKVYEKIKPQELYDLYDAYHSMDNELAIKRILESKNIEFDHKDKIEVLRKIYNI